MGRTVVPQHWLPRGEAVVDEGDRPVMVWGGIPGEPAEVKVIRVTHDKVRTAWIGSPDPHPERVQPACDRYAVCGRCPLMHLSSEGQAEARTGVVRRLLDRRGLHDVAVDAWHPSPPLGWLHLFKLSYGLSDHGRMRLGAWGRTGSLVPIPGCPIATPTLHKTVKSLAHYAIEMELYPYEASTGRGILRRVLIRQSRATGEVLVTLIASRRIRELADYAEAVAGGVSEVAGVWVHLNSGPSSEIFTRTDQGLDGVRALVGRAWIEEEVSGVRLRVGPGDVLSPNPAALEGLHDRLLDLLDLGDAPLVALDCGPGALPLAAAARGVGWVLGTDASEDAVGRAREAARLNDLSAQFTPGEADEVLPDVARRLAGARAVVAVDVGRKGLTDELLQGILALSPLKVAYRTHDPRVLARDLAALRGAGLQVAALELFDTRPHVPRSEALAVLVAPDADESTRRAPRRRVVRTKG